MTDAPKTFLELKREGLIAAAQEARRQEAAERAVRRAVRRPTLIKMQAALLLGTALGRRPRSAYVPD